VVPFTYRKSMVEVAMTDKLFIFSRSTHDAQGVLTGVQRLAFMGIKLPLQIGRGFLEAGQHGRGSLELLAARGTDGDAGNRADVFHDPNSAFGHDPSLAHDGMIGTPVNFKLHHYFLSQSTGSLARSPARA
jgi:hypothetical protein